MRISAAATCVVALAALGLPLRAQDSLPPARALKHNPNGSYTVVIGNDTMLAITRDQVRHAQGCDAELRGALAEAQAKDSLIASLERAASWSDSTVRRQLRLIAQLDSLYRGYQNLAMGYKHLSGEPWLTFEGGLGATGRDHKPALIAGVGIRRVRVWGFLQEANAGGAVGVSLRLF